MDERGQKEDSEIFPIIEEKTCACAGGVCKARTPKDLSDVEDTTNDKKNKNERSLK